MGNGRAIPKSLKLLGCWEAVGKNLPNRCRYLDSMVSKNQRLVPRDERTHAPEKVGHGSIDEHDQAERQRSVNDGHHQQLLGSKVGSFSSQSSTVVEVSRIRYAG